MATGKAYVNYGELKCADKESVIAEINTLLDEPNIERIEIKPMVWKYSTNPDYYFIAYRIRQRNEYI